MEKDNKKEVDKEGDDSKEEESKENRMRVLWHLRILRQLLLYCK